MTVLSATCLIPRFDGAILSQEWKEALWDKFVTGAPRSSQRGATGSSPLARARRQSCNTAIRWLASVCLQRLRSASFARAAKSGAGHQPQDGGKVAQAGDGRRYEDWAVGTAIYGVNRGRRSDGGRIPASYAAAVGRLPLCPAVIDPAHDPFGTVPASAASWHLAPAGHPRRHAEAPEVQARPYPLADRRCMHRRKAGSSISTSPRCRRLEASSISLWALTERPSSPSLNSLQRLTERPPGSSCSTCSTPCPTRSTPS